MLNKYATKQYVRSRDKERSAGAIAQPFLNHLKVTSLAIIQRKNTKWKIDRLGLKEG
jgi:hypothetical protein